MLLSIVIISVFFIFEQIICHRTAIFYFYLSKSYTKGTANKKKKKYISQYKLWERILKLPLIYQKSSIGFSLIFYISYLRTILFFIGFPLLIYQNFTINIGLYLYCAYLILLVIEACLILSKNRD